MEERIYSLLKNGVSPKKFASITADSFILVQTPFQIGEKTHLTELPPLDPFSEGDWCT